MGEAMYFYSSSVPGTVVSPARGRRISRYLSNDRSSQHPLHPIILCFLEGVKTPWVIGLDQDKFLTLLLVHSILGSGRAPWPQAGMTTYGFELVPRGSARSQHYLDAKCPGREWLASLSTPQPVRALPRQVGAETTYEQLAGSGGSLSR